MNFELKYNTKVIKKDIPALPKIIVSQIKNAIENKLLKRPEVFGKPLRNSLYGFRSLRVGDYRIIFWIKNNLIQIELIQHRTNVYKDILKRMGML